MADYDLREMAATIPNGLPASVMRNCMENKNLLNDKGSMYIGTGNNQSLTINNDNYVIANTAILSPGINGEILRYNSSAENGIEKINPATTEDFIANKSIDATNVQLSGCFSAEGYSLNRVGLEINAGTGQFTGEIPVNGLIYYNAGDNYISIGNNSSVTSNSSIAVGSYASASGEDSLAIGSYANASGDGSIAILGEAREDISIAIFGEARERNSIAIGSDAIANASDSMAIGDLAFTNGFNSISIGSTSEAMSNSSIAIGSSANASGESSMAIGNYANASGNRSTALGYQANASGDDSIAILGEARKRNSIAIGIETIANASDSMAIGDQAFTNGFNSICVGYTSEAMSNSSIAIGSCASASGDGSIAIGNYVSATSATGEFSLAIGEYANASEYSSFAIGVCVNASGEFSLVIGDHANASGYSSLAIGSSANASGENSLAIGSSANASNDDEIVLGSSSITALRCQVQTISALSDSRVKEDITLANTAICLSDVNRLPVSRFKYKKFTGTHLDEHRTGFMADDVEKVFPKDIILRDEIFPELDENGNEIYDEIIQEDGTVVQKRREFRLEKVKSISMAMGLPTLWGAVQELSKQFEESKQKIIELENRISILENNKS